MHHSTRKQIAAFTLIAVVFSAGPRLVAQEDDGTRSQRQPPRQAAPSQEPLLEIRFGGGTVAEYVRLLKAAYAEKTQGRRFNLIVTGTPELVKLPAFELFDTTINDALEALEAVAHDRDNRVKVSRQSGHPRRAGQAILILDATGSPPAATRVPAPPVSTSVFSIRQLTNPLPGMSKEHCYALDAVLGAIEAGLEIARDADESPNGPARVIVKHHAGSGLLFVRGSQAEISMIQSVLSNLEMDMNRRHAAQQQHDRLPASSVRAAPRTPKAQRKDTR